MNNTKANTEKNMGESRRHKFSAYLAVMIVIVFVLIVVLNILVTALDDSFNLRVDVTDEQFTRLTDESLGILGKLDQDIYLYYIGSSEQDDVMMTGLLKNYAAASDRISFRLVDPNTHPGFTQQYDPDEMGIENRTVIVSDADGFSGEAPERYKVLGFSDQYSFSTPYYDTTGALVSDYKYFKGEQKVTSAIDYIMTGETKRAVFLAGHSESIPCKSLLRDINALYYDIKQYDFKTAEAPLNPSTDTLIVISPRADLSDDEYADIKAFLEAGGKAIFFMDSMSVDAATGKTEFVTEDLTNFKSLLLLYDVAVNNDVVVGGDPSKTYKSQTSIIPALSRSNAITLSLADASLNPVLSFVSSIKMPETTVADVSVSTLLQADESSYAKSLEGGLSTFDKEPGDKTGPFTIGAMMRKGETMIALYTSSSFVVSEENYGFQSNARLFLGTLNHLNRKLDSVSITMRTIYSAADTAYKLDIVSDMQKVFYMIIVVGVVPLVVLIVGVARWFKRRSL